MPADAIADKDTVNNWADAMIKLGGVFPESLGLAIFMEMAGMTKPSYLRSKTWNLAFNLIKRGVPELGIIVDDTLANYDIHEILDTLRRERDDRSESYDLAMEQFIDAEETINNGGKTVYQTISVIDFYKAVYKQTGIFMPLMTSSQTARFTSIMDKVADYQEYCRSSAHTPAPADSFKDSLIQLSQLHLHPRLRDDLAAIGIDAIMVQEIVEAWGFRFGPLDGTGYYRADMSQTERDCHDYWFELLEYSTFLYTPIPPPSLQALYNDFGGVDTHVEGDYMINQWYLMQFECHIREFTSIDKKLVKALGRDLT
ncbi:MAG: hypothetical protein ACTSV5_00025, partial [Promethearchaeota archaeon]